MDVTSPSLAKAAVPSPALRAAAPAILLAAIVLAPFLGKSFTIDDTFFLQGALQAATDFFHPTAFDIVWGDAPERAGPSFGPLMSWLLVPAVQSEWPEFVAHLVELAALALALVSTASLAARLGVPRAWAAAAAILLATSPTVLAMSGTAMADVPAMALGVAGIERLVAWKQERRWGQAVLAAIGLGLAPLARPHAVLLLAVGGLLVAGDDLARREWRGVTPALIPIVGALCCTIAILVVIRDPSPGAPGLFGTASRLSSSGSMGPNLVAYFTHWVVAFPLAFCIVLLHPLALLRRGGVAVLAGGGAYYLLANAQRESFTIAALAGLGFMVVWFIITEAFRTGDRVQLSLGAWLLVPLVTLPYAHLPAKINCLSAPAACIIIARSMAALPARRARVVAAGAAAAGVLLGLAILRADAMFAGVGRRAATELIAPRVAAGERVWFVGQWGFQWYAEQAGARPVTITPPFPVTGDAVVISTRCYKGMEVQQMLRSEYRLVPIGEVAERGPGGRVMSEGAGFFSNVWGFWPWTWGADELEEIVATRVVASRWNGAPARP
jgi:hypothetical protein